MIFVTSNSGCFASGATEIESGTKNCLEYTHITNRKYVAAQAFRRRVMVSAESILIFIVRMKVNPGRINHIRGKDAEKGGIETLLTPKI
jgi:hypothetical protein